MIRKFEGKISFERPVRRWEEEIGMDLIQLTGTSGGLF
jgi:hypothetical protein